MTTVAQPAWCCSPRSLEWAGGGSGAFAVFEPDGGAQLPAVDLQSGMRV
nr:hypothetical protein [Rhodococcus rhodochrous]